MHKNREKLYLVRLNLNYSDAGNTFSCSRISLPVLSNKLSEPLPVSFAFWCVPDHVSGNFVCVLRCLSFSSLCFWYHHVKRFTAAIAGVAAAPFCQVCKGRALDFHQGRGGVWGVAGLVFYSNVCHLSVVKLFF